MVLPLLTTARTRRTELHRDERAASNCINNLKPASTVSSRAKWFKSEVVSWSWREESNNAATLATYSTSMEYCCSNFR
jgi:hypothetical protein